MRSRRVWAAASSSDRLPGERTARGDSANACVIVQEGSESIRHGRHTSWRLAPLHRHKDKEKEGDAGATTKNIFVHASHTRALRVPRCAPPARDEPNVALVSGGGLGGASSATFPVVCTPDSCRVRPCMLLALGGSLNCKRGDIVRMIVRSWGPQSSGNKRRPFTPKPRPKI